MRSVDGKTLLEFLVLCLFEIVIVIAILMVVGVLPWPSHKGQNFDPIRAKEPPPAVASQNAPAPAPAPVPTLQPAPEPVGTTPDPQPAPEPAPEPTPEPPPPVQAE